MDPPAATEVEEVAAAPPPRRRQRRGAIYVQRTLLFTISFVILSLLKLEPLARHSAEDNNNEINMPHNRDQERIDEGIPRSFIFVDTRYHNISEFPRLVRENIDNTIKIYSDHWNETNVSIWFLGAEQCERVIQAQSPDLLRFYHNETFGPYKSDICRVAALYQQGGYYFDNDVEVTEAISTDNITFIMPITMHKMKDAYVASNTFIGATPRHVIIQETFDAIIDYYRNNHTYDLHDHMGPATLWNGYIQASKKYSCDSSAAISSECNNTWSIFDLTQINLDQRKELYPEVKRRKGWGCCCNWVIQSSKLQKIYFWSRFLGAGGSCRFKGGKTADDIE